MNGRGLPGAYEYLRSRILSGELPPQSRIKEQEVAVQLGLSRTPVREALARLEMEGLVKISPRRGAVVVQVELDEIDEIFDIRAALETLVARRACERATEAEIDAMERELRCAGEYLAEGDRLATHQHSAHFHLLLNRSSRSPRLAALLRGLEERLAFYRRLGTHQPGRTEGAHRQHLGMLEALRRKDLPEMHRWIEEHAERGRVYAIRAHMEEGRARRMDSMADPKPEGPDRLFAQ